MNFETIKLEKDMYRTPKGFAATLESLDPSENYKGSELGKLDAFGRQLKRFGIGISGQNSCALEKFFATTDSATLFPEYVSRAVKSGMEEASDIDSLIATRTNINSLDYRTIKSANNDDELDLKDVSEGSFIPETVVKSADNLVSLKKRGRMLVASYEALKFQRLDLFTMTLKRIGAHIAKQQFADAVAVLLANAGTVAPKTAGTLNYDDFLSLWKDLFPYNLNTIVASPEMIKKMMLLPEFKNADVGFTFAGTGKIGTPVGAKVIPTSAMANNTIVALDNKFALEMVTASGVTVDHDRLIDRQLERTAITCTAGFACIFDDAVKKLTI